MTIPDAVKTVTGKNFATGLVLVVYVLTVALVWAWCSIQTSAPRELPPSILQIGFTLLAAHTGVNVTDKFKKS